MAVRLRLKRLGRKNRAFFRMGAFDSRTRRNGRAIEELGNYDPHLEDEGKKYNLNRERIEYWLSVGAKPTNTVASILLRNGISIPGSKKQRGLTPEGGQQRVDLVEAVLRLGFDVRASCADLAGQIDGAVMHGSLAHALVGVGVFDGHGVFLAVE